MEIPFEIDLSHKRYLVGIDPGFNNMGLCIYDPKTNHMDLFSGDWFDGVQWLGKNCNLKEVVVVLENPALDSATFKALGMVKGVITQFGHYQKKVGEKAWPLPTKVDWAEISSQLARAFTTSQKIGESKAAGKLMKRLLEKHGVTFIEIAPSNRDRADKSKVPVGIMVHPTKTNSVQFQTLTGYSGRSNEHSRDAATLVWGKDFKWVKHMMMVGIEDKAAKTRQKSKEKRKSKPVEVPKEERKFFNVHDPANPGQRVELVDGKFKFVDG